MKYARVLSAAATVIFVSSVATGFASGQTSPDGQEPTSLPVNTATSYKGEEFLLIGSAVRGAGEPVIAINPKNPDDIIVGAMSSLNHVDGERIGVGFAHVDWNGVVIYRNTPGASISAYAISHDRGITWHHLDDPFRDYFNMNGTADAFVGAGADGSLFIGAMNFFPQNASPLVRSLEKEPVPGLLYGNIDMASSSDGGKTWTTPWHVMGQATPLQEYAPGLKPHFLGKTPYDRGFVSIDQSTGTLYVPGSGTGGDPVHMETFVRASEDNGKTWGLIHSFDSPDFPQAGMASRPAAANGALGVAYVASAAPAGAASGKCPCVVFGVSRDKGNTFERSVVQTDIYQPRGFFGMGSPALAADPSHPGRFAVMTLTDKNTSMQVSVTDDYGKTWKPPVKVGSVSGTVIIKPDIGYSPHGDLAVMWLATKEDGTYTMWSNASRDGGTTFGHQIQVSESPSPARGSIKDRGNNWDGDDLSSIAVDNDFVHIVWADGRAGFLGAWYARVPLASYF